MSNQPMYKLEVLIADEIRKNLVDHEYSFGLRKTVSQGATAIDNVAFAVTPYKLIGPTMTFEWDESYQIGATTEKFEQGKVVSQSKTKIVPIVFKEVASIGENFNDFQVTPDPIGADNGFGFAIDQMGPNASAIIYMDKISGGYTFADKVPAFISPIAYVHGSKTMLTPLLKVKMFFQQNIQTGTMTTSSETNAFDLDFTKVKHQKWSLDNQGNWKPL